MLLVGVVGSISMAMRQISIFKATAIKTLPMISIQLSAQFWGYLSPAGLGVDALKFVSLKQYISPISYLMVSVFLDRVCGFLWITLIGISGIIMNYDLLFPGDLLHSDNDFGIYALIAISLVSFILFVSRRVKNSFLIRAFSWKGDVLRLFLWSGATFLLSIIRFYLLFNVVELSLPWPILLILPFVILLSSLWPLSLAGMGVVEVSIVGFLALLGVSTEQALAFALTHRLVGILTCVVGYLLSKVLSFYRAGS